MRFGFNMLLVLLLAGLAFGQETTPADLAIDGYRLPLVGHYAILREAESFVRTYSRHRYELVESTGESSSSGILPGIQEVAVAGTFIIGKTDKAYFLLNAQVPYSKPQIFSSPEEWQAALAAVGIPADIQLRNPDTMAARLPDRILRPWKYRMMKGLLGYPDDIWSFIVQLVGFAIAFLVGLLRRSLRSPFRAAIVLGILVNILAQILIAGGGPGAFVGFFLFPVLCYLAILIGKMVRWLAAIAYRAVASGA